jgi:protein-S-isoprenylcysteine O-methyltransferase Ste14
MNDSSRRLSPLQRIPPPFVFVVPLLLGIWLEHRLPLLGSHPTWTQGARWVGGVLVVLGVAHALSALALFARSWTTLVPHHKSAALVTAGAYRWTRNPMYVGLTLVYVGVSVIVLAVWPILLLPLPLLVMNFAVIPMEERLLGEVFGADYAAYKTRVRRWI